MVWGAGSWEAGSWRAGKLGDLEPEAGELGSWELGAGKLGAGELGSSEMWSWKLVSWEAGELGPTLTHPSGVPPRATPDEPPERRPLPYPSKNFPPQKMFPPWDFPAGSAFGLSPPGTPVSKETAL